MALHRKNFQQLKAAVKHALGKTGAPGLDYGDVVNDALMRYVISHTWNHRKASLSLNTTADQEWIALPEDFAGFHVLKRNSTWVDVCMTSLDEILWLRTKEDHFGVADAHAPYKAAVSDVPQTSITAGPTKRLEIWPTPTSSETGAFRGIYIRQLPKLTNEMAVPDVPPGHDQLIEHMARLIALEKDHQIERAAVELAAVNRLLNDLKTEDGRSQADQGPMRGGLYDARQYVRNRWSVPQIVHLPS